MYDDRQIEGAIEGALESLDITPAMFHEAEGHYKTMGDFLCNNGAESDISAFGSIATGTVVRPYAPDEDSYFDFDVLCRRTDLGKNGCEPADVRGPVEKALEGSDRYRGMTKACDECLTVEYVLNGKEGGFRLDLNPCVDNTGDEPEIEDCSTYPRYASSTVSIARRNPDSWLGSNPEGLIAWFRDKNERFAAATREAQRRSILRKGAGIYASVDDVPWELERTPLQRSVQFAKRSRDVHYHVSGGNRPPSCMIMALMVEASEYLPDDASTLAIVRAFIAMMAEAEERAFAGEETIVGSKGSWGLRNPVYGGSLIDESWTDADMRAFFRWARTLDEDLRDLALGGVRSEAAARSLFGKGAAAAAVVQALPAAPAHAAPSVIPSGRKPWRPAR